MQTQSEIDALIMRVASTSLGGHKIARVTSEPGVDHDGLEAVRVTIVLSDDDVSLTGDAALNTIVEMRQALQSVGDDRFPFVDFTNESELASDADFESEPSP